MLKIWELGDHRRLHCTNSTDNHDCEAAQGMAHRAWAMFGQEHIPPFPTITITHSSISVYTCSVRVPQAHTPRTETVPGYNARGQEKICTRSVTNPLCTPPFVAQLTLQTSYILGFSSASAHKQSHYWPDATREGRRCGACEAGSRRPTLLLPTQTHAHALPLACRTLSSGTPGPQTQQHRAPCMCLSPPPYLDAPHGIPPPQSDVAAWGKAAAPCRTHASNLAS